MKTTMVMVIMMIYLLIVLVNMTSISWK